MREIKFRAWVKTKDIMREVLGSHYNKKYYWLRHGENNNIIELREDIILMQYTGFKDKKGKEIYDGDILYKDGYYLLKVEYDKGTFWVRDLDIIRYNNLVCNYPISEINPGFYGYEVIGNIYEYKSEIEEV